MPSNKAKLGIIITLAVVAVASFTLASIFTASRQLPNEGSLKTAGVAVYWDGNGINETRSIDWGTLSPNSTKSLNFYVKNNGTAPVVLSISTNNWSPSSAQSYMPLNWNCTGYNLDDGAIVCAVLTMTVSADVIGIANFSFDITITGTGS